jgi:hypothetical protein
LYGAGLRSSIFIRNSFAASPTPLGETCAQKRRGGHALAGRRPSAIHLPFPLAFRVTEPTIVPGSQSRVTRGAQGSPVRLIPEQLHVATMRHDMVDNRRRFDPTIALALLAQRMVGKVHVSSPTPSPRVAQRGRTGPLDLGAWPLCSNPRAV